MGWEHLERLLSSLQLGVLRLGFVQDGDVGVGVFRRIVASVWGEQLRL